MENPFLRKGIKTIIVYPRNQLTSEYYINDSTTPHALRHEQLELFLKQAFPRLSFEIAEAFSYHDYFYIDVKKVEYHRIDLNYLKNQEEIKQDKRKDRFNPQKVEKELKAEKGSKQKSLKDEFSKSDKFFKKFFKK